VAAKFVAALTLPENSCFPISSDEVGPFCTLSSELNVPQMTTGEALHDLRFAQRSLEEQYEDRLNA
jgi:hypothetical protein